MQDVGDKMTSLNVYNLDDSTYCTTATVWMLEVNIEV